MRSGRGPLLLAVGLGGLDRRKNSSGLPRGRYLDELNRAEIRVLQLDELLGGRRPIKMRSSRKDKSDLHYYLLI